MIRKVLFDTLARLAARSSAAVLLVAVLVTAGMAWLASDIQVKTNFKDTLGPDDPVALDQAYLEENFPGAFTVVVALDGAERGRLIAAAQELESLLQARPELVRGVYLEQPVDFFVAHGLLFEPLDDLRIADAGFARWEGKIRGLRADPSLLGLMGLLEEIGRSQSRASDTVSLMTSKMFGRTLLGQGPWEGMGMQVGVELDLEPVQTQAEERALEILRELPLPPSQDEVRQQILHSQELLGLLADVLDEGERYPEERFRAQVEHLREVDLQALGASMDRYTVSEDGQMLLMEVSAVGNINLIEEVGPFLEAVRADVEDLRHGWPDVRFRLTGFPVMVLEEEEALIQNFGLVTLLGFIGVLAVFIIGFERVGLPALSAVPLVMGMVWTFGLQSAVYGDITLLSLAFPVLLLGVGIDFAIHLLSGYAEQRQGGADPEAALQATFEHVGPGMLTGGLTTAAAFLVMMTSEFYGLRAMGFTAGAGVLMALVAMLVVLPALVVRFDLRSARQDRLLPNVPFAFLGELAGWIRRGRYGVLAVFLVLTITFAWHGAKVRLNTNYMDVLPQDLPSLVTQDEVLERFGRSNDSVILVAGSLEEAEALRLRAQELPTVSEVFSVSALLPTDQEAKAPVIEQLGARLASLAPPEAPDPHDYGPAELSRLRDQVATLKGVVLEASLLAAVLYDQETQEEIGRLRDTLNRIDRRIDPSSAHRLRYLDSLIGPAIESTMDELTAVTANTSVTEDDLPASLVDRMRGEDGAWMVLASANGDVWNDDFRAAFLGDLESLRTRPMGLVPSTHHMMRQLVDEIPRMTALIFGLVAVLVLFDLRSLKGTVLALVPLVVGVVWTLGVMGMLGLSFNMISITAIPMIVGIGIDDGIHLYHRIRKDGALEPALSGAGKAIVLTSLTTSIGFGSLMLSIHPGFFSLGLVTTVGILSCLAVSLLLLPALVAIFDEDLISEDRA